MNADRFAQRRRIFGPPMNGSRSFNSRVIHAARYLHDVVEDSVRITSCRSCPILKYALNENVTRRSTSRRSNFLRLVGRKSVGIVTPDISIVSHERAKTHDECER